MVVAALFCVVLFAVAALVIDYGDGVMGRREAQTAADAAALAAAQDLPDTSVAAATARRYVASNLGAVDWTGCVDPGALALRPDGGNGCISFDAARTRVRVRIPTDTRPVLFGAFAGSTGLKVSASATAQRLVAAGGGPCGLCIIGDRTLQLAGLTKLAVTGGEIQADRLTANNNGAAATVSPLPLRWWAANNSNWGRNDQPAPATFNSRYSKLSAPVPNPFAHLTVDYTGLTTDGSNVNYCNNGVSPIQPGRIYTQNVNINCGTVTLASGTYHFANTLTVGSGATLRGTGVTLVFGCSRACTGEGGKFVFNGNSTVAISAPTSGAYANMAIMFDPGNASGTPNQLGGRITLDGAVYAKKAGFNMGQGSAVVNAWTIVSGGNFDLNAGTLLIDNTRFGGSGSGANGSVSLLD